MLQLRFTRGSKQGIGYAWDVQYFRSYAKAHGFACQFSFTREYDSEPGCLLKGYW